jgi:DNA-binding NtrC family response regulator
VLRKCFGEEFSVKQTQTAEELLRLLERHHPDLSFLDIRLLLNGVESRTKDEYRQIIRRYWDASSAGPLIVLTPASHLREAVKAVKVGASNYLTSPIDPAEAAYVAESLQEFEILKAELSYLRDHFWQDDALETVRTESPLMRAALEKIRRVAPTRTTVLLTGETGVGKSTLARLIHRHSDRREKQFISVHCGAIPDELLESELFGHERGAFTGAVRRKLGKFEVADLGTIFLDEVGLLTPAAQIKLLSVIQERSLQRVGSERDIQVDVRIVAATNVDLRQLSQDGSFRRDLYYRLNVFPIEIPPLRERMEDLPHLVHVFVDRLSQSQNKLIDGMDPDVLEALRRYHWPGNVRELENLIERACILEETERLTASSFPPDLFSSLDRLEPPDVTLTLNEFRQQGIETLERQYLEALLTRHRGRLRDSAATAAIGLRQLHKLLTKHGLRDELRRARKGGN